MRHVEHAAGDLPHATRPLRLDRATTIGAIAGHAARVAHPWPAVHIDAPEAIVAAAIEHGAEILCARLATCDHDAVAAVLRGLAKATRGVDASTRPPAEVAALAPRALRAIAAALRPHLSWRRLELCYAAHRSACIARADEQHAEATLDARGASLGALALRAGRSVVAQRDASHCVVASSVLLHEGPDGCWSVGVQVDAEFASDQLEVVVLRHGLPALLALLAPALAPARGDEDATRPLFRPAAFAAWRLRPRATGVPAWWSPRVVVLCRAVACAVLLAPLALLVPVTATTHAPARVVAAARVELPAPAAGAVARVVVAPGQSVRGGDLLLELGPGDEPALAEKLAAYRSGIASALLASGNDAARAVPALRRDVEALAGAVLRAPRDGSIADWQVRSGDVVAARQVLGTLLGHGTATVLEVDLPARHARNVRPGDAFEFALPAEPERRYRARIATVAAQADGAGSGASVRVRADVASSDAASLVPGSSAVAYPRVGRRTLYHALFDPA